MTDEVLPESPPEEGPVHFLQAKGSTLRVFAISLALILGSLGLRLSGWPLPSLIETVSFGCLVVFPAVIAGQLYDLATGNRPAGLLVDGDGIVDRTTTDSVGRVYWEEIKAVYPVSQSFFPGFAKDLPVIGLDVTDSYLQRTSAGKRRKFWWTKRVPNIQIPSQLLRGSRDEILKVLQDRLEQYELRSVSEAKRLESGSES